MGKGPGFHRRDLLTTGIALAALPFGLQLSSPVAAATDNVRSKTVDMVEAYLNTIKTLSARFLQVDNAGNVVHGQLYMRRPGRLRFEYDAPSPLLLVADGTWLILHDKELGQVNRFPLYETPMGVLVDDPVNLRDKVEVIEAEEDLGIVRIKLVDREVPDEGWLGITFTEPPMMLRQWRIKDAQGGITALSLTDIRINRKLDPKLFVFLDPEPFSEN
ncbi:MAG: outer membrane lipoprotein carrier protein LolA [Rhodospirillaceae bacterium]|nr:outer membrane lipoprotein carrier protein LolA [Rhodospirillaceae bacterium]